MNKEPISYQPALVKIRVDSWMNRDSNSYQPALVKIRVDSWMNKTPISYQPALVKIRVDSWMNKDLNLSIGITESYWWNTENRGILYL